MDNFFILIFCFLAGLASQKWQRFPANTAQALNAFVIAVSLPSLMLLKIPNILSGNNDFPLAGLPVLTMWAMFFICWLLIHIIGKKLHWSQPKIGALILTTGLANTSFVGIPVLKALIGEEALPYALLADQPGEFLIVSTMGIIVASLYAGQKASLRLIVQRIISFPPFVTLLFCLPLSKTSIPENPHFVSIMTTLANTLVPLALFAVGHQCRLQWSVLQRRAQALLIALPIRLIAIPGIFFIVCYFYFDRSAALPLSAHVTLLETAMATQITAAVVANEFQLDGEIANLMVAISIPLSLLSVPVWHFFSLQVFG